MLSYTDVAIAFASALVDADFVRASSLLAPELRSKMSPDELRGRLLAMFTGYASGPPTRFHFEDEFTLQEWPSKQPGDVGWAYVSVEGDDFVEAVSVIVSNVDGSLLIRDIEWGRP